MPVALTSGYIYFLESDAVDNQDWVIISSPTDPEDIDLTNFTEGTEYCKLEIPQRWQKKFATGIIITDSGAGSSFAYHTGRRGYSILAEGIKSSVANADLVEKFFMIAAHNTAGASFNDYYMVIKFATNTYATFIDETSTSQKYCRIRCQGGEVNWTESDPNTAIVRIQVRSLWS